MHKQILVTLLIAIVIGAAILLLWPSKSEAPGQPAVSAPTAYKSGTYIIDGQPVTLVNGTASTVSAPGSASQTVTQYFGNVATGDLNGDGVPDAAFLLTQTSGGSGTFYYVVAALKTATGYQGTNAILLGDRIAPQTTEIKNGQIVVNYADRAAGEPMTAQPSVGVTKYISFMDGSLMEMTPTTIVN
ncbi:MAG TPA: hypothetical protein VMU13_02860 [Candidatus Paceibacterota bacterium]|nr:hypothetical protein [Candidatus Paceibacterota bacterium]